MKNSLIVILLALSGWTSAQSVKGIVVNGNSEVLPGASVIAYPSQSGISTDSNGKFEIKPALNDTILVFRFVGTKSDTLKLKPEMPEVVIILSEISLKAVSITGKKESLIHSDQAAPVQILTESALRKSACCNLSESFETNGAADVSFSDALSGARHIRLLGLDGRYASIFSENIPSIRGLSTMFGLMLMPGTMLESIQISKGTGSVVNGYEGTTGMINLEMHKPFRADRVYLNGYVNMMGRSELNLNLAKKFKRWSQITMMHGSINPMPVDRNKDGFLDMPLQWQGNIVHRWRYDSEKYEFQTGIRLLSDNRSGGTMNAYRHNHSDSLLPVYKTSFTNYRAEWFTKSAFHWPSKPYKSLGIMASAQYHALLGSWGTQRYDGNQKFVYLNAIYESIFSNTNHKFRTGFSFMGDSYREFYADTFLHRTEWVPGGFFEYTFKHLEKFTLILGIRNDYNSLFGNQFTPKLNMKWTITEGLYLRVSSGRGFRVANLFTDNSQMFISSRKVVFSGKISPEISWNSGAALSFDFKIAGRPAFISGEYYRTDFVNQVLCDLDDAQRILFYNLKGLSFSNAGQLEFSMFPVKRLEARIIAKYQDVRATYQGRLLTVPYVPVFRGLLNLEYILPRKKNPDEKAWSFDATLQLIGSSRIPQTFDPQTSLPNAVRSPWFVQLYAQITRKIGKWELYVGGENLTDYRQKTPVIDPQNPYGSKFDASQVWGPIFGAMVYGGFRYNLK
jgi:hypothetical protein